MFPFDEAFADLNKCADIADKKAKWMCTVTKFTVGGGLCFVPELRAHTAWWINSRIS